MSKPANTMTRWRFWLGWNPEPIETWLEQQAAAGWHLVQADRGLLRFHFRRGEPQQVCYTADFPARTDDQYPLLYTDAGWELVAAYQGWHLWRQPYAGEQRPAALNDTEALVDRNHRLVAVLAPMMAMVAAGVPLLQRAAVLHGTISGKVLLGSALAMILVLAGLTGSLFHHNRRLKARKP